MANVLARLGPDKYSDFDFDLDHISLDSYFAEYFEGSSQVIVKGRLKANISFWQSIGASKFILDTLSFGYKIPFSREPTIVFLNNNRSALGESDFVESAIQELLRVGSIVSCTRPPEVVNPLSVSVQSSGKKRLILDLRHVNFFVNKSKIKFEDAQSMLNFLIGESLSNLWAYSFDIKSGYHHVEIYPTHQRFLGFSWVFNGVRKYFKFVVLPFGLSTGPYIFTKVMRPLVKHWRSQALRIVVYLDDGLGVCGTKDTCLRQSLLVHSDLISSGFVPNKDKCMWIPSQLLRWLGFHWDFARGLLSIPEDKISVLLASIGEVFSSRVVTARMLAQVTGRIISCMLVFGHICKIMTKALHSVIVDRASWNAAGVFLTDEAISELNYWCANARALNSRPFVYPVNVPHHIVYSDASDVACASYIYVEVYGFLVAHKNFDDLEMKQSSTWRELKSVSFALRSFAPILHNSSVKLYTDNKAVAFITDSGSNKPHLNTIAKDIFCLSSAHGIRLSVEWIPRTLNQKADYYSKIVDFDDWCVSNDYFRAIDSRWGPFTVDCFASYANTKLPRFYSRFYSPNTLGVDALSHSWQGENCWLVPPVCLVTQVIEHVKLCKCVGALVVPYWPSAIFWPSIINEGRSFRSYIVDFLYIAEGKRVFVHGVNKNCIFGSDNFSSSVLFLRINGAN